MISNASLQVSSHSSAYSIGEGCHLVVFALGPFVERVVVALSAYHLRTQKELRGVGHVVQFHAGIPEVVTGGAVFPWIALCSNQRIGYLIERFVGRYLLLDPMVVKFTGPDLVASPHSGL